jgi:starvation-inducible DNA-binding protein
MVALLIRGHDTVARTARALLPAADAANDQPTLDLITQRLDIHEKTAWMLRSLLEE